MPEEQTIVALLTAKGQSSLQNKNLRPVAGRPLLAWPARAAARSRYITHFFVSSENKQVLDIATGFGYKKILRPKHLSTPEARHIDVIYHSLDFMKAHEDLTPDILVVLLGNNVTIKAGWIDQAIEALLKDPTLSAAAPVRMDQEHHPYRAKKMKEGEEILGAFFDFKGGGAERGGPISSNRQDLEPCYFFCHNFWALNLKNTIFSHKGAKEGEPPWGFMGPRVKPVPVQECFDVHSEADFLQCEKWLEENPDVQED